MEIVTTICIFLVMFGTGQANVCSKPEIYNHGDNATVFIEKLPTDRRNSLEVFFSGFTKKLNVIHMIIMAPNTNNGNFIQVSRTYSGRIKDINMNNGSITFLLLNVNFMDSGNYTVFEGSLEKGKRCILVTGRILSGQVSKPMILPFTCNNTNTSSITIGKSHAFDHEDYIIYDVARKSCTFTPFVKDYNDRIDSCVIKDANFDLAFRELIWSDKGAYTAWDAQGLLLDSVIVGITDNNISSPQGTHSPDSSSHKGEKDNPLWPLFSSVAVVLVAAFLAIMTVRKLRQNKDINNSRKVATSMKCPSSIIASILDQGRFNFQNGAYCFNLQIGKWTLLSRVPKTTINNLRGRNGNPNIADISRNRHFEEATSSEESAMNLAKINNTDDPADFPNNKSHEKVKSNDKHYYARGFNSKLPPRNPSKLQIHSSVSWAEDFQSETTHGYNSTRKCVKLKTECWSDKPHLSLTKSIPGPSFEYDYVVQGTWMTSRAPAPDPVVTKQNKGKVMTDDSILWHRNEDKTSSSRVDPSTLYASVSKKRTKTHCTDSSAEKGSRDLNIELPAPRSFKLESAASADFKSRGAPQSLNYELARDVSDDSSALEREHRENQSCDVFNEDLMVASSVRPSRKSSVRTFMDEDCYDSHYSL